MLVIKLILFAISGSLIAYGLVLQVRGVMNKGLSKKTNQIAFGVLSKFSGRVILAYLIINYKTQDLIYGLISFFIPAIAIILWVLLARRPRIG